MDYVDIKISPYFTYGEFACKCPSCKGRVALYDPELVEKITSYRKLLGKPITIVSAFRCPNHSLSMIRSGGQLKPSQHTLGKALDLTWEGLWASPPGESPTNPDLRNELWDIGFNAVGMGHGILHVDVRKLEPGQKLGWYYDSAGNPKGYFFRS